MKKIDTKPNPYKAMREKCNLLQSAVADCLGITQSTVSMWETGESNPRTELLIKLASLYNCTVDELLGRETATEAAVQQ